MSNYTLFEGLLLNLVQKIPSGTREYLTREQAYTLLKEKTGQDFGYHVRAWKKWLKKQRKL